MPGEFDDINRLLEDLDLDAEQFAEKETPATEAEESKEQEEKIETVEKESAPSAPSQEPDMAQPEAEKSAEEKTTDTGLDDLSFLEDLGGTASEEPKKEEQPTSPPSQEPENLSESIQDLEISGEEQPDVSKEQVVQETPSQQSEEEAMPSPPSEEKSILDSLSDEQITQIFTKIKTLHPALRKEVKNIILNDKLSQKDMETLINYLLLNEDADIIQAFVERTTGVKISTPAVRIPGAPPLVKKQMGPSIFSILSNNLFPILRLLIPVFLLIYLLIAFVISPIIKNNKAKSLINNGVKLILSNDIGEFKKAENNFKKALSIKKNYYSAYIKYGDAYSKVDRDNRAERKYTELINIKPDYIEAYFKLGSLYEKDEFYHKAIKTYQKIFKYKPDNIKALDKIATIYYYKLHNKEKAKKIYKDIIKNDPENIYAHYGLLSLYIIDNDIDNVEREHYQVLKYKNKYMDLKRLTDLARYYIDYEYKDYAQRDDLFTKAEDTLKKILDKDPKYSEALYEYARLQYKRKDLSNAISKVSLAIKYNNEVAKYHNFLGELYVEEGNLNYALDEFNTAVELDNKFYKAHYNLGNINYYGLNNYETALYEYLSAAEGIGNEYIDINYNLGWIYYKINKDYINADKWFTYAKEDSKTENPIIRFALGNVYLMSKKYSLAVTEYMEAVDFFKSKYGEYPTINKENDEEVFDMENLSAIYNNLGVAYLKLGNEKQALLYFWKAVESAKKINYNNENASARINIQYVLETRKSSLTKEPAIFEDIPKTITPENEEKFKNF